MKTLREFDCAGFMRALAEHNIEGDLNNIDVLVGIADGAGCWTKEFFDGAVERSKKVLLRKVLRDGFEDDDGVHHEFLCVEEVDAATQEVRRGYKQLEFFSEVNCEWAMRDCRRGIASYQEKYDRIADFALKRFGRKALRQIQLRLDLEPVEG